jgi:hypothetical protein
MVASTIGGYISGRLRTKWTGVHSYEIQFRDTAHGFLAWAFGTLLGAAILGAAATYLIGGVTTGAAAGVSQGQNNSSADYFVALMMRPPAAQMTAPTADIGSPGAVATANESKGNESFDRARFIIVHDAANGGDISAADRSYLAQLVSVQTGINQADAEKRVSDTLAQAKAEADEARKAGMAISIWISIAMLIGAFSASLAAIEGGQLRDRRWRGLLGARGYTEARIET